MYLTRTGMKFLLLVLVMVASLIMWYPSSASAETNRLSGTDRYETAVKIALQGWPDGTETVVLARGDNFADALTGATLAYKVNGPILLTQPKSLPQSTKDGISQLGAKKVILLGGETSISKDIQTELETSGITVERIGGNDRFETAVKIAEKIGTSDTIIIAYGRNFPDALAIAPYAAMNGYPILLTDTNTLPSSTKEIIDSSKKTYIIGGNSSVGEELFPLLKNPERIAGNDRFETAAKVIQFFNLPTDKVHIAYGRQFADALTGSVLAAKQGAPILLSEKEQIPSATISVLSKENIKDFTILGGLSSVSGNIENDIETKYKGVKFEDINLEIAVRNALEIPTGIITFEKLNELIELNANNQLSHSKIENLNGLQYAENLSKLDLSYNNINDITTLGNLKKLQSLNIKSNKITNIQTLGELTR